MADARVIPFPVRRPAARAELERKRRLIDELLRFIDVSLDRVRRWLPSAHRDVRADVLAEAARLEATRERIEGHRRQIETEGADGF